MKVNLTDLSEAPYILVTIQLISVRALCLEVIFEPHLYETSAIQANINK